jgi:hypothetical protein
MVYYGTETTEYIVIHEAGEHDKKHYIGMTKHADMSMFTVRCDCSDWRYDFMMENNSDYDRIKFNIMEAIFECEDVDALLVVLSEVFEDGFGDILIEENECNCDGSCENCNCKN